MSAAHPMSTGQTAQPRVARARTVMVAALAVAVASILWFMLGQSPVAAVVLVVVALVLVGWAAFVAVRRESMVVAPAAVVILALCNPLVMGAYAQHLDERVGRMSFEFSRGIVFWHHYPDIVGWEAPSPLPKVDTGALVRAVQSGSRAAILSVSAELDWSWRVGKITGLSMIPNGFGGNSMFQRVDMPTWSTDDYDGSTEQREVLMAAVELFAQELWPDSEVTVSAAVTSGVYERVWADDLGGRLSLTLHGEHVELAFRGGPYFSANASLEEYEERRADFAGLTPPTPIFIPELP